MYEEQMRQYSQIVAKCWADSDFKARLLADPNAALAAEGIAVPEGMELRIVENTPSLTYIVLPEIPQESELTDEALGGVVGGGNSTCGDL